MFGHSVLERTDPEKLNKGLMEYTVVETLPRATRCVEYLMMTNIDLC